MQVYTRRFAHIAVGFRFIAGLVVSIQPLTVARDVVNITVVFVNEYHYPADAYLSPVHM